MNRVRGLGILACLTAVLAGRECNRLDKSAQLAIIKAGTPEVARLVPDDKISVSLVRHGLDENRNGGLSANEIEKGLKMKTTLDSTYRSSSVAHEVSRTMGKAISR